MPCIFDVQYSIHSDIVTDLPRSQTSLSLSLCAKDGGKEKGGEPSGRSCFQDGGMFNGRQSRNF